MQDLQSLKKRFEIPRVVRIESGRGNLTKLVVTAPSGEAEIYLHGAHVTHFAPAGQKPVIWISEKSWFEPGKPIRGGVPVCFPWFGPRQGDANAPAHGFARLREWEIEEIKQNGDAVVVALVLKSDEATKKWWPADFVLRHMITVGQTMEMKLAVQNTSAQAIWFEEALHTYFCAGEIKEVSIEGLGGTKYIDKVDSAKVKDQMDPATRFTGETDRVYLDTQAMCVINDPVLKKKIEIAKTGSNATVVWNPWSNKAKAMPDFGDEEWPTMVCVETANVGQHAVELAPAAVHEMVARIRVL